jgi:hypothetical protein
VLWKNLLPRLSGKEASNLMMKGTKFIIVTFFKFEFLMPVKIEIVVFW